MPEAHMTALATRATVRRSCASISAPPYSPMMMIGTSANRPTSPTENDEPVSA
jgi:hypothetical protein